MIKEYWQKSKRLESGSLVVLWIEEPAATTAATPAASPAAAAMATSAHAPSSDVSSLAATPAAAASASTAFTGTACVPVQSRVELVVCVVAHRGEQAMQEICSPHPRVRLK